MRQAPRTRVPEVPTLEQLHSESQVNQKSFGMNQKKRD
jgi:hypothetical protein